MAKKEKKIKKSPIYDNDEEATEDEVKSVVYTFIFILSLIVLLIAAILMWILNL